MSPENKNDTNSENEARRAAERINGHRTLKGDVFSIIDRISSRINLSPEQKRKYTRRGAFILAITVALGVPIAQNISNHARAENKAAELEAEDQRQQDILDAIYDATNADSTDADPIYTFRIDSQTPTASHGVEKFTSDPNSAYSMESDKERSDDFDFMSASGKMLGNSRDMSNYWALQPNDVVGIYNDKDLDGDGDNDMYLRIQSRAANQSEEYPEPLPLDTENPPLDETAPSKNSDTIPSPTTR